MAKRCEEEAQSLTWKTILLLIATVVLGYLVWYGTADMLWVYLISGLFFLTLFVILVYWYTIASKRCRA